MIWPGKGVSKSPWRKFGAGKKEQPMGALWVHCRGMGAVSWAGEEGLGGVGVCVCVCRY